MTTEQAKEFLKDEFGKYLTGHPFINGSLESLFNDRISPVLDEAVHDLAGEFAAEENNRRDDEGLDGEQAEELDDNAHESHSQDASEINNGGLDSQLDFLCAHSDDEKMKEILLNAIHEAFKPDEFSDPVASSRIL